MALSTKLSESFKDLSKEGEYKPVVERYDISNYTYLYREINNTLDEMNQITKKYIKEREEAERTKIKLVNINYKGSQTIIESNRMIIFETRENLTIPLGDPPDDSNRKPTTNIQNELLNIHKVTDFASIEKIKNDRLVNRYNLYKERLKKIESKLVGYQQQQQQERKQAFIRAIKFIKYSSTVILCIINYVVLINIFNPVSWINIGLSMYNNIYYYRFFSNIMGYLNLFNTTDLLSLDKLFGELQIFLKSKNIQELSSQDRDEYVKMILQKVFQPGSINTNDITNKFSFYDANSPVEKFFVFIYNSCQRLNIFDDSKNIDLKQDWLTIVYQFSQSSYGIYGMSQIGLIFNTLAYFERAEKLFNSYSEINPMIIFKEISTSFTQSLTFAEYNKLISSKMLEYVLGDKTAQVVSEVPFIIDLFGTEMNINGEMIKQLTKENVHGFFITTTESLISILTNSTINGYFYQIEKEAKDKQVDKNVAKTMEEKILEIEINIRKRGKYVSQGYSTEKIPSLLSEAPKSNDYKFFALRFIKEFYNKFGSIDDPVLFVYTLTSSISLTKFLEALLKPTFLTVSIYSIQNLILSGMYNTKVFEFKLSNYDINFGIKDIVKYVLKLFFGNDEKINSQLNLLRNRIINELTNDVQVLLADISKIFFDTRIGINIETFINKINSTIFGKIFTMSCKIIYNITAIPQFQLYLTRQIPVSDIKFFNILKDKNTMIKYFSVIRNKISNLFTIIGEKQVSINNLFKEIKSFFEIHKIIFNNVMPFVANTGYYFYDVNKPFEFKGNCVKTLNNLFIERLEEEEKKPSENKENLLEYQPKPTEIEKEIIIIEQENNSMLTTVDKKEIINKTITNGSINLPKGRNDDLFLFYYYYKFIIFKKQQNPSFKPFTDYINLKELDNFLFTLSNDLRNNLSKSNGIQYAIINDLRASIEEKYKKGVSNLIYPKKIKETTILKINEINSIENFISQIDVKNQKVISETKIELNDLLLQNSIITTPFYTAYGSGTVISNMNEFLKTTEIINFVDSNQQSQDVITAYQDLQTLALKTNNNNIYSDLTNLDYTLSKTLKKIFKQFSITRNFIEKYLPGALKDNKPEDEYGVTFKHLGFDYNIFSTKIMDNLKNTKIGTANDIFLDKITEYLDIDILSELIISESEILYVCDNGTDPVVFLDHSKSIDINTGNQYNCNPTFIKNISDFNKNIDVIKKILFTPEVILRLNGEFNTFYNKIKLNPKYISILGGKKKIRDFFSLISKIVDGINVNGQKVSTIYNVIDETIDEMSYTKPSKIESYKFNILKDFQISLRESVKRGYVDKNIMKQINNFFKRKEILLDRYNYINKLKTDFTDAYSDLLNECSKITQDPNSRTKALTELANFKKMIDSDKYNSSFTLSDIKSTKPGGSENFYLIQINIKFNEEKNKLLALQNDLNKLRAAITTGTMVLNNLDEFCKESSKTDSAIKNYIEQRNNSLDEQFNFYKISLLSVSENIFSELKKSYEINSNNIQKLLTTYEKELEQLKNKYNDNKKYQIPNPTISSSAFNPKPQTNVSTQKQPTPSPTKGPTLSPVEKQKPSTQQAKDLKRAEKLSQSQSQKLKEELKQDLALKEEQAQGLEESLDEQLSEQEKLQLGQQLGFSGSDNTFSYLANLVNIMPPIVTTTPQTNIELQQNEPKEIKQENKNALDVCKSYSGQWSVEYLDTIYDIVPTNMDKQEAIACSSNNILYLLFNYINNFMINFVANISAFLNSFNIDIKNCGGASIGASFFKGFYFGIVIAFLCVIFNVAQYLSACIVYISHFCLSFSVDTIIKNKNLLDDKNPNISLKIFLIAWFYSAMSLNKIIKEKQIDNTLCFSIGLDSLFKRIYKDFDMNNLEDAPRNILSQFDTSNKIDSNAIGIIDLGKSENGLNFSNPKDVITFLTNVINSNEQSAINLLTSKSEKKTINCNDFNFGNKNSSIYLRYVILGTIQNLVLLKPPNLLISYLGCLLIDDANAIDNLTTGGNLYLITASSRLLLNIQKIYNAIQDVFVILLGDPNLRPLTMTYLFGSSSTNKNKNIGREIIENAISLLEKQFPKQDEFINELKNDVDKNFGSFFIIFQNNLEIIWQGLKNLFVGPENTEIFTLDKKIMNDYDFYRKSRATVSLIFSSLVEPSITLVNDNTKIFSSIDNDYKIQNINDNDEIFKILEKMINARSDPAQEDKFYDSFVFNTEENHINNDPTKGTLTADLAIKKKRTIVNEYISILQLYKKRFENNKAINSFVLGNAKKNVNQWFNFPFNNFIVVEKITNTDIKSAISYHLLKPCKNDEVMLIKDTNPPTPECIKISEEYIKEGGESEFKQMMRKYEVQFIDLAKTNLEESRKVIDTTLNIRTNLNDIIISLNNGSDTKSKEYIDVSDIYNKLNSMTATYLTDISELNTKYVNISNKIPLDQSELDNLTQNYYNKSIVMLKSYIEFLIKIKDEINNSISQYVVILKSQEKINNDKENLLKEYKDKGKEPSETDDEYKQKIEDLKNEIDNFKIIINDLEKKINDNKIKFDKCVEELNNLSSSTVSNSNFQDKYKSISLNEVTTTDDPLYFAYLYTSVINKIDRYNLDLLDIFKVFNEPNLTIEKIKSGLNFKNSGNKYYFDNDNLNDKIIKYKQYISNILGFYINEINKEVPTGAYRQVTRSDIIYINNKEVKNNQNLISLLPDGSKILSPPPQTGTLRHGITTPIYQELYKYGYYIKVSSKKDTFNGEIKNPVIFGKISTKFKEISEGNYYSGAIYSRLYGKTDDYIDNNGSITKFKEMIPPILVDYVKGKYPDLDDFVLKNYVLDTQGKIFVLKSNLELYKKSYEGFDENSFFVAVGDIVKLREDKIKEYKDTFSYVSLYSYYFSYYDEYYDIGFNYFDNLVLNGSEDKNRNTIDKIAFDLNLTTDKILALLSITPISVFQPNLNNINYNIDPNSGDITDMNYQIVESDVYEI